MENIAKAIIEVQKEIKWIEKNSKVWSWNFAYSWVNDKDVKTICRESMSKNWLCIVPISVKPTAHISRREEDITYQWKTTTKQKQSIMTEVETKYMLLHESWEYIEIAWYGQWVDSQDKWAWKATTYALKYALLYIFLIPTGAIDDTDNTHSNDIDTPNKKTKPEFTAKSLEWSKKKMWEYSKEEAIKVIQENYTLTEIMKTKVLALYRM